MFESNIESNCLYTRSVVDLLDGDIEFVYTTSFCPDVEAWIKGCITSFGLVHIRISVQIYFACTNRYGNSFRTNIGNYLKKIVLFHVPSKDLNSNFRYRLL